MSTSPVRYSLPLLRTALLAGTACLLALSATARAADEDLRPQVTVNYADLNLATPAGNAALYRRIAGAAQTVCWDSRTRDLASFARARSCRRAAIAQAVQSVHSSRLAALVR